jgi:hypothetical protein
MAQRHCRSQGRVWVDSGQYLPDYEMAPVTPFQPLRDAGPRFCRVFFGPFTEINLAIARWSRAARIVRTAKTVVEPDLGPEK